MFAAPWKWRGYVGLQAKVAALDGAGFYDPFHAEKARQGADKMNNIIAMYTR